MFTGIIEAVGRVSAVEPYHGGRRIVLETGLAAELAPGASIAVDGACLTVVAAEPGRFAVDVIGTTLSRTTLGAFRAGSHANLERALPIGARLDGHLVQGHVDALGEVLQIERRGEHVLLDVRVPEIVAETIVPHGAIAINGVSLTVNDTPAQDVVQVALIPFTWDNTTFAGVSPGDPVNLEGDVIGKYVVAYLKRVAAGGVPWGQWPEDRS